MESISIPAIEHEKLNAALRDLHSGSVIVIPSLITGQEGAKYQTCWSLFFTGPRYRQWGFACPQGWIHWKNFTDKTDAGKIGKGCNQEIPKDNQKSLWDSFWKK